MAGVAQAMGPPAGGAIPPRHVRYNNVRPLGYATLTKLYKFNPQGFLSNNIGQNDIVRFIIQTDGFWDPWSCYLNLTVDFTQNSAFSSATTGDGAKQSGKCIQLDGSAQSHFNSLIIYHDGVELERIMEYDTIANVLLDMNYNPLDRRQREQEGVGGINASSLPAWATYQQQPASATALTTAGYYNFAFFNPRLNQTIHSLSTAKVYVGTPAPLSFAATLMDMDYSLCYQSALMPNSNGLYGGTGAAYNNGGTLPADNGWKELGTVPVSFMNLTTSKAITAGPLGAVQPTSEYVADEMGETSALAAASVGQGFEMPWNCNFSHTCFEPRFSGTQLQKFLEFGVPTKGWKLQHQYSFPLISGLFGILMTADGYHLIPMSVFRDIVLEFKMNPYAYFTSSNTIPRDYRLNKFEIMTELVYFDGAVDAAIKSQFEGEGVLLKTVSYYLGPIYNITNQQVPGSMQVNLGFESLKSLLVVILAGDYSQYNICRKQFRLSHNISYFQIKIGTDFYPQQAIQGCAGTVLGSNNNAEFYIQLLRAFGKLHRADSQHIVGMQNFAVNDRDFDPTAQYPAGYKYDNDIINSSNTTITAATTSIAGQYIHAANDYLVQQYQTNDYSFFAENRLVGKCIYGMDLEGLNYDPGVLNGVNTIYRKPFEVLMQCAQASTTTNGLGHNNQFKRNSSIYIFCLYDFMIQINRMNTRVLGRG